MEKIPNFEQYATEFIFDSQEVFTPREQGRINPEAYPGCLIEAMKAANNGMGSAMEAIDSTIIAQRGSDIAMACGKCGLTMVRDRGTVYGASRCPEVKSGETTLGILA